VSIAPRFEAVRHEVLTAPRNRQALWEEVRAMRERVRQGHAVPRGRFDVKHSPGGMMDAEFAVQFLVLLHGGAHPELLANAGNIALLQRAEEAGLLPSGVGHAAADGYRELRRIQHRARLDEQPTHFSLDDEDDAARRQVLTQARDAILAVWRHVMEAGAAAP
jgi:glutamate-ammonia-ligase adenylyltransferase